MFNFWHNRTETSVNKKLVATPAIIEPVVSANRQGLNKAGIIVTKELEEAIERCRRKVQRIAKDCRRHNRRFRDPEFDLLDEQDKCLHGLPSQDNSSGPTYYPSDVLRVNQIFENPKFFINGATASDITQGSIGDCWFLSGLSLIATAGLVEKICVERDEQVGVYGFIFWRDAGWVDVIVDDLLFVKIPKWREVDETTRMMYKYDQDAYIKQARKGSKILYFSKSATENETWVPLIEKAYAKLHGDYAALDGGLSHEAIEDLSGAVSNWMYIRDTLDPERFWDEELLKANQDRLFACSIVDAYAVNDDGRRWQDPLNGLVAQHAYSVVKAMEYKGVKFVKIRNPWGMYEWQGRWSDGSKEWNGEWLEALKALDYRFGNDGEFLMEYSDFLNTWDSVERCRLFDENWALSQLWLQVSLGEHPRPTNFGDVSFTINLSKPTSAVVMLSQLDTRYFLGVENQYKFSLSFLIFKYGEKEPIASSYHDALFRRSVNVELDLEAGDYVVHVKIDRQPPAMVTPYILPPPPPRPPSPPSPGPVSPPLPAPYPYPYPYPAPYPIPYPNPAPAPLILRAPRTSSLDSRKKVQKKKELLISASIAANFRPSNYSVQMPLAEDLYQGVDLTSMEIAMYDLQSQFNAQKKAAFAPNDKGREKKDSSDEKDDTESSSSGEEGGEKEGEKRSIDEEDKTGEKSGDKPVSSPTPEIILQMDETNEPPTEEFEDAKSGLSSPTEITKEDTKGSSTPRTPRTSSSSPPIKVEYVHQEDNTQTNIKLPPREDKDKIFEVQASSRAESSPSPVPVTSTVQMLIPREHESSGPPKPPENLHEGYYCDGHGGHIIGSRFHCLDIACPDYDLCEYCIKLGVHNPEHQMLEIKEPDRELTDNIAALPTSDDVVTVGLKVYASKDCEVSIKGQLRHKNLIRNYVTMSRII